MKGASGKVRFYRCFESQEAGEEGDYEAITTVKNSPLCQVFSLCVVFVSQRSVVTDTL